MSTTLRPLCTATYELGEVTTIEAGEHGTRLVAEILDARFEGERLKASLSGRAAADWATVEADGRVLVDVRLTLKTDDGVPILVHYHGRGHVSSTTSYSAPLFETGDDRYAWLTRIQVVGKSVLEGSKLQYEMYEVV